MHNTSIKTGKIKTTDCSEEQEDHDSYNNVAIFRFQMLPPIPDTPLSAHIVTQFFIFGDVKRLVANVGSR